MNYLSHILEIRTLSDTPKHITWTADSAECKALAERLKINKVESFSADIIVERGNFITVKGDIKANVVQSCVVTGEPVKETISENFEEFFCEKPKHTPDIDIDMDSPDITPIEDGRIDVFELACQYLILSLNPYPRKKGAAVADKIEEEKRPNPFAVLEKLKH